LPLLAQARTHAARLHQGDADPIHILLAVERVRAQLLSDAADAGRVAAAPTPHTAEEAEVQFILAAGSALRVGCRVK
jgi:hypothetical protein